MIRFGSARYAPSIPEAEIVLNKGHGVARTVPVFCAEDYCVYYFCIKELEDILCRERAPNTFGGWRLGGYARQQENSEIESELTEYGRYSFNPLAWKKAFGEFNSLLFSQLDQNRRFTYVLQFDLSNFYDSVRLDRLERSIREEADSSKGWIIALLFFFLNQWNRRNTGLHPQAVGLPQDALADCSRILANFYLRKYDYFAATACQDIGAVYFRYSDDQMILLDDPSQVGALTLRLTRRLDRDGLRMNQKKVTLWTVPELIRHRCRRIQAIFLQEGDNKDPKRVRAFVIAYLQVPETKLRETWDQGLPLLNRLLYANLESLSARLLLPIITRMMAKEFLERADHKQLKRVEELNARLAQPFNLLSRLKNIAARSVHNAFHYQLRAYAQTKGDAKLQKFCESRLAQIHSIAYLND